MFVNRKIQQTKKLRRCEMFKSNKPHILKNKPKIIPNKKLDKNHNPPYICIFSPNTKTGEKSGLLFSHSTKVQM